MMKVIKSIKEREMKFNESISLIINTNISNASIRGSIKLPHSVKQYKILAITENQVADDIESTLNVDTIKKLDFDRCISDSDGMSFITQNQLSKLLGTKGLMPNQNIGTLNDDLSVAAEVARNSVFYRAEKNGILHILVGKANMGDKELKENIEFAISHIKEALSNKFQISNIYLDSTQGKAYSIDEELNH